MISAGSRDGRKMAELGFDVGGGCEVGMEDTELEEGEACLYRNDEEVNIDPDDFSYIDEKLQNVLGHFKKDFEGGVFTENLGAKYGGYGSFLTQRSPVRPYSNSPANVQNSQSHKSPTCLSAEGCTNNSSLAQSNGRHSLKHKSSPMHAASAEHYKAPSQRDLVRQHVQARKHSIEESTVKTEAVEESTNIIEPRPLKVRIKMGSDNLSAKKNAAIYNGLGLVSPSSSFDDSPIGGDGLSQGLQFPGDESPNQIIRVMTSLPVYEGLLLSPLPEALAQLTEKLLQDNKVEPSSRHDWGSAVSGSNGMTAKIPPEGKNHAPSKRKKGSERARNESNLISKNQAEFDAASCEELVSEALKLPLLSDFHGSSGGKRGTSKQKPNALRHEPVMPILKSDGDWNKKRDGDENLAVNVASEDEVDLQNDVLSYQKKGDRKGQAVNSSTNTSSNNIGAKSIRGSLTRPNDTQKRNIGNDSMPNEQEGMKLASRGEQLPLGDKKKVKGSYVTGSLAAEISKGSIKNVVSGNKDSYTADDHSSKMEIGSFPKKKDFTKFRDTYNDFFGDVIEDEDDSMDSPDEPSIDRLTNHKVSAKGLNSRESHTREGASKGDHEQLMPRVQSNSAPDFAPPEHVPLIGEPAPAGAPVEDWVQCDKCLKWRLLPFGIKGDSLPEKWLCSMLNWLPGMNSCSITEEETTKAVARLCQPQNINGVDGSLQEGNPRTAATDMHPEQSHKDVFPVSGKKHGLKEMLNSKHSLKNNGVNVAAKSQTENEPHAPHSGALTDTFMEANQHKKKSKKKHHDKYSSKGHSKITKREVDREPNQDHGRASKKMKVEEEAYMSAHDTGSEKLFHNSNKELLISGAQKNQPANRECSSRSSKGHTDDSLQNPISKSKFQAQASPHVDCLNASKDNGINAVLKKRKGESSRSAYSPISLTGKLLGENEEVEPKKARISLPEKKASSSSRGNSTADKKRKGTKAKDADEHRFLKRDIGSAATSSSSKVSGSQRSKSILRDVKSSPVESVSSSPIRTLDSDRYPSGVTNVMEKDTFHIGILAKDDLIKVADAKAGSGIERSGATGKHLYGNKNDQYVHDLKDGTESFFAAGKVQNKHSGDQADLLDHCNVNGSLLKQSAKDSSQSNSSEKNPKIKSESDKGKVKITGTNNDLQDHAHVSKATTKDSNIKFQSKSRCNADSIEIDFGGKKKSSGILLDEPSKRNSKLKSVGQEASTVKADTILEMGSASKKKANTGYGEKRSKRLEHDKEKEMDFQRGKEKATNKKDLSNSISRLNQGNGADVSGVNVRDGGKGLKEQTSSKKPDMRSSASKHQLSNVHKVNDRDTSSPMRRDSHNHAAINALKEAKDLKHLADRLKHSGSAESTGFYFEAALKFLHGASLLESRGSENSKRGDVIQSMQVYSSTAKLCEFCAHEYEKSKDQACAALAYKCMEVAYLRVTYSTNPDASRDRHELQRSLQMVPPGESPSSSASDIDNASNLATAEKAAQARDGNSPQPAGNHVISASNRPNFERLLRYMQDVNSAMEASRRAQGSFVAAQADVQQAHSSEGLAFVKRVVNFNFHDVEGLLRLVRLAVEAIKQ